MHTLVVVTGTRAEYGLLRPVLRKLLENPEIEVRLVVTGAHLSREYGYTAGEIEADGMPIDVRLNILIQPVPEGREGTARRTAIALEGFLGYFSRRRPTAVLLLGDRYEMLAAGEAAALLNIPVAHISGGDVTFGADDDWFRHCLTKMAKLHFVSCEAYRQRVIRMGEDPWRVHNVGGLGDENVRNTKLLSREALNETLHLPPQATLGLVTFHPETAKDLPADKQVNALLGALACFPGVFWLFTAANADAGGEEINRRARAFCETSKAAAFVPSLGMLRYLSAMKHAAVVVGNSSSGVVESPSLGTPTVDIGERQAGRVTAANVIHCGQSQDEIENAIRTALTPAFNAQAHQVRSPYNGGDTAAQIARVLAGALAAEQLAAPKQFYDGEAPPCEC